MRENRFEILDRVLNDSLLHNTIIILGFLTLVKCIRYIMSILNTTQLNNAILGEAGTLEGYKSYHRSNNNPGQGLNHD